MLQQLQARINQQQQFSQQQQQMPQQYGYGWPSQTMQPQQP